MLWQTRKKLRQFARQRIQNLDVKTATRRSGVWSVLYYFIGWNLVGGVLAYMFFFAEDPDTGKKTKFVSPEELKQKVYGPPPYILVTDEQGRQQQERNPDFDKWLEEKDKEIERRRKEIDEFKKRSRGGD